MRYVLVQNNEVENTIEADQAFADSIASDYQAVIQHDKAGPGWAYDDSTGELSPPTPSTDARPELVITSLSSDDPGELVHGVAEITCKAGSTITVAAELRAPDGTLADRTNAAFRMPLRARDGRERIVLVSITDGTATVTAQVAESGRWSVTEDAVNEELPEASRMRFSGLTIFTTL